MSFLYKVDAPTADGKSVEPVELELKDIKDLPLGVLRKNRNDFDSVLWATFEWGLSAEQLEVFDRLPVPMMMTILDAWQESDEDEDEDEDGAEPDADAKTESADDGDGAPGKGSKAATPPKKRTPR